MRSAIVESGIVTNVIVGEIEGSIPCSEDVSVGWLYDGGVFTAPPLPEPDPTPPAVDDYRAAIQTMLDHEAQSRLYDSGTTIATYVNSTNPQWAAEATTFVAWRDAVWAYAYTELEKVVAGEREQPTVGAFLAELPAFTWPNNE